jgi:hypothetical protein
MDKVKSIRKKKDDDNISIKSSNSRNSQTQSGGGNWKEVAKNLKKQGSQIFEEKKIVANPPKLPWANLSIDTAVVPPTTWSDKPPSAPTHSSSRHKESSKDIQSNINLSNNNNCNVIDDEDIDDDDDEDDEEDSDDDGTNNPVANAVWGVASSLIGVTMSMFNSSSSSDNSNLGGNKAILSGALKRPSNNNKNDTITDIKPVSSSEFNNNSLAPPTDKELFDSGIGPPKFLAAQVDEQVKMIRTGLTPRRINPRPPDEVRQAVAVFKAENEVLKYSLIFYSYSYYIFNSYYFIIFILLLQL